MDVMISIIYKAVMENNVVLLKELFNTHHISLKDLTDKNYSERFLFRAVEQNYQNMVKFLVENGANVNSCETVDMSPLLLAISLGNLEMTELLIDLGSNIGEGRVNQKVVCPLHFAVSGLNLEIVLLLLSKGANVYARDVFNDETALNLVSNYDYLYTSEEDKKQKMKIQVKIAKALLDKGAAVDSRNCIGLNPVECALIKRNTELCKLLFLEGASVKNIKSDGTYHEYLKCVVVYPSTQLTRLCLERGCDYSRRDEGSLTPYHDALLFSKPDVVKVFLKFSCPFDLPAFVLGTANFLKLFRPNDENLPVLAIQKKFIEGIKNNSLQSVKTALSQGAEPKGCSMDVPSTLHYVTANGNHELIELLLKKGVPVNRVNIEGETPLFIAVKNKNVEASEVLLKFGACIYFDKRNSLKPVFESCDKLQKLFEAINNCFKLVRQGNKEVLKLVQSYNLSNDNMLSVLMNCVNRKGLSLMAVALQMGHTEIAESLMKLRIEKL